MFKVEKLGLIDFQKALEYQNKLVSLKQKGSKTNYFLMMEHEHVFTMGKGADLKNILDKNIPVIVTNRGGDITYHGPGQLTGYIIFDLRSDKFDIHGFLRYIELLIIGVLNKLDIDAYQIEGLRGVWAENKKVASIGIGVKKGITMHGFALNVNPDLSYFSKINPCGLNSSCISSITELKKSVFSMETLFELFIKEFPEYFE
ncbi:MAG: lipoyl(octanoyl) transferase LipB [Candidatus Gastranaerophilales bacterium]|nr:lipoyl(octanoyl) transferase LipB [Candidatus Gastranaerophilales bacterium]